MGSRAGKRALGGCLALAVLALALGPGATAAAGAPHEHLFSFGPDGTEASSFADVRALAFDDARRRLYVRDPGANEVRGFDASAAAPPVPLIPGFAPLPYSENDPGFPGLAVDNSALPSGGDVYFNTVLSGEFKLHGYEPAGAPLPGTPFPIVQSNGGAVAVGPDGRIWVGEVSGTALRVYSPQGALLRVLDAGITQPGLAFDSNGDLYVSNLGTVVKLSAASDYSESTTIYTTGADDTFVQGIAVDKRTHHLFIAHSTDGKFGEYDSEGELLETAETGLAGDKFRGIGVDPADHRVYVADETSGKVHVFSAGATTPSLGLQAPDPLQDTSATLHGTVAPEGLTLDTCRFEWVSEAAFHESGFEDLGSGGEAPCEPEAGSIPASGETAVSAAIGGLQPGATYRYRITATAGAASNSFADAFTTPGPPVVETTGTALPSPGSATLGGRLNPQGAPTEYHFEYGTAGPCDANPCQSTPTTQLSEEEVQQFKESSPTGSFTLSFAGDTTAPLAHDASGAAVQAALAGLESIGPGNVRVAGGNTTGVISYYTVTFTGKFAGQDVPSITKNEPANPINTAIAGGSPGSEVKLVAAHIGGLQPGTTYHYRLVADNGDEAGQAAGADMTFTTHAAAPLSNERYPHPPGNDRAWEQVSSPDSGGNPVNFPVAFAAGGNAALFQVSGGTPISSSGTIYSQILARRPPGDHPSESWRQLNAVPRSAFDPKTPSWEFEASADFSRLLGLNTSNLGFPAAGEVRPVWRVSPPGGPNERLIDPPVERSGEFFEGSADASRAIAALSEAAEPSTPHLYDISEPESPQRLDLLPGGAPAPCGVVSNLFTSVGSVYGFSGHYPGHRRWLSADGRHAFFPSRGTGSCASAPVELYVRDIGAGTTSLVSGPALSGPECSAAFIRATPGAAFFWTRTRLAADDRAVESCSSDAGGDVYRYEITSEVLSCVTCRGGQVADVALAENMAPAGALAQIGVAAQGSAVYFHSPHRLVPGAAAEGVYRVAVGGPEDGRLDYVAPAQSRLEPSAGDAMGSTSAVSADGSVLVFRSADPRLDPQGGTTDGGFPQYYLYRQSDRSLTCVSCPADGSAPRGTVGGTINEAISWPLGDGTPVSADGQVFAFGTPSALVGADQNTIPPGGNAQHGQDVYEWRGGRALLISDGIRESVGKLEGAGAPQPAGVSASGRDVFFLQTAQLTPDALDGYRRLYDARLGGGIDFPAVSPPCPLDACQGIPEGTPEASRPGSADFAGAGNVGEAAAGRCPKGKRKVHRNGRVRCVKRHRKGHRGHRRAGHNRRAGR